MRKKFPKKHKQLWLWLSANPLLDKRDCPIWEKFSHYSVPTDYCFACEEAVIRRNETNSSTFTNRCSHCPIHKMIPGDAITCLGGLYAEYVQTTDLNLRSLLALKIANLPWR